jgi:hypothetical protein
MTHDEIIEMARKVGLVIDVNQSGFDDLEIFAKLVAAKEREACAKLCDYWESDEAFVVNIAAAIKEALEQPEQEPVAWMDADGKIFPFVWNVGVQQGSKYLDETLTPLYTYPPQRTWEGLSVFEINDLVESTEYEDYQDLVERTEAKLKEKNT